MSIAYHTNHWNSGGEKTGRFKGLDWRIKEFGLEALMKHKETPDLDAGLLGWGHLRSRRDGGGLGLVEARPGIPDYIGAQNRETGDREPCQHASSWAKEHGFQTSARVSSTVRGAHSRPGICGSGSLSLREMERGESSGQKRTTQTSSRRSRHRSTWGRFLVDGLCKIVHFRWRELS